ncbi:MAG: hypothetical protein ABH885_06340, partial [Candidatus Omnitrophota bacterium]
QVFLAKETDNIPANKDCEGVLTGHVAQFADDMDNVIHPRLLPIEEFPLVTEAFDKGIQSIMIGESTPAEVAEHVEQVKQKELAKAAKFKALREKQQ